MNRQIILDTGPLVAYLQPDDAFHDWAVSVARTLSGPLLTSEPVLTEAAFLLMRGGTTPELLFDLVESGLLKIAFNLERELPHLRKMMRRYANLPMSLADASLVRLAELFPHATVWTLDRHFTIYRKQDRLIVPTIIP